MTSVKPKQFAAENVHNTVLSLLINEERGKLLDAGAGEGALTAKLLDLGFDVEPCDFNDGQFKVVGKYCKKVDLNLPLPYLS